MPSLIEGFLHWSIAAGAALAAVPLVIHLLNRRRHRPMAWGAMRFVIEAYKRTRRRAQLENLLLLLLRMAVIALLALALARPFTSSESPLASLTETRRHLVLVLDGSASTGYRENVSTVFERIVARARKHLLELDAARGDRVRLILAERYAKLLSWREPKESLSILSTLTDPGDGELDLAAALGEVVSYAEEEARTAGADGLEVRVLTDLQRTSFEPGVRGGSPPGGAADDAADPDGAPALTDHLDRLTELGVRVIVEDLGPGADTPANLGVSDLRLVSPLVGPGEPIELGVRVDNHGPSVRPGVRLALSVDGERRRSQKLDVPARGSADFVFPIVFNGPGHHVLEARLEGDALPVDDVRQQVLFVPPSMRLLLVNGDPGVYIEEDEVGFLRAVLELSDDGGAGRGFAPFLPRVIEPAELDADVLDPSVNDVVVLANVEGLSTTVVEQLEAFTAAGGVLIVSVGDRVVPQSYNARLWRPDGSGLLPAELERRVAVPSRRDGYFRVGEFDAEHPALEFFADERWKPLLTEVPVYEFLACAPLPSARVLASLDDEEAHPLLVEREYDRGRVFLWTTSLDADWTRLPESPATLVPLFHELLRYAGRPRGAARNVPLGTPLSAEIDAFPRGLTLIRPDGSSRPLEGDPLELGGGSWRLPPSPPAEAIGLWRIETSAGDTVDFAVQLDPREGDLDRIPHAELAAAHPAWLPLDPDRTSGDGDDADLPRKGELWRGFAKACLIVLVLESLWAAWIGRSRRIA